jgi:uncharacterized repeat protein (TIGR03803 family)
MDNNVVPSVKMTDTRVVRSSTTTTFLIAFRQSLLNTLFRPVNTGGYMFAKSIITRSASVAVLVAAVVLFVSTLPTHAAGLTTIHSFTSQEAGDTQSRLVAGTDGNLYGTAPTAGGNGIAFKVTPAGALTILHVFTGAEGANPVAGLTRGTDGNFYGVTFNGGAGGLGTVFRMTPTGTVTLLSSLTGATGFMSVAPLVQGSDGNFYGSTQFGGGDAFVGSVFRITPTGAMTVIHSFTGSDGGVPQAELVQGSDGNFYGTTTYGGDFGGGTAFSISSSGAYSVIHSFGGEEGSTPLGGLAAGGDGFLYGTTSAYGNGGWGSVYRMGPTGAGFTVLYTFDGSVGATPHGTLVNAGSGKLYGTTSDGGNGGSVFQITTSGSFSVVNGFNGGPDGGSPFAGLAKDANGNIYGTTSWGGGNGLGTVFQIPGESSGVGPPTTIRQCQNGGWATFTIPRQFRNQGDCTQYVNTGR